MYFTVLDDCCLAILQNICCFLVWHQINKYLSFCSLTKSYYGIFCCNLYSFMRFGGFGYTTALPVAARKWLQTVESEPRVKKKEERTSIDVTRHTRNDRLHRHFGRLHPFFCFYHSAAIFFTLCCYFLSSTSGWRYKLGRGRLSRIAANVVDAQSRNRKGNKEWWYINGVCRKEI